MQHRLYGIGFCSLLLGGCATMNTQFSCNKTAGDSCLTIEQVDAMTRFADDEPQKSTTQNTYAKGNVVYQHNGQAVWIADNRDTSLWA